MKKRRNVIGILVVVTLVILIRQLGPNAKDRTLNLVTWSQYFPKAFLDKFTADTGLTVRVHLISSNEELFAKLKAGATGYDVMQPSDYMVERLAKAAFYFPSKKNSSAISPSLPPP